MIPDIEDLRGSLVEIHADEGADLSKAMLDYIKDMQDEHEKILTCYYDVRGNLRREDAEQSVFDKIWMVPTLEGRAAQESLMFAMKNTDIVVIDDITYVDGDLRRFVGSLEKLTRKSKACVFLLNQKRFVRDRATGLFEEKPYRYDVIEKYCKLSADADTGKISLLQMEEPKYDSFVEYLIS